MDESRFCRLCLTTSSILYSLLDNNGSEMLENLTGIKICLDTYSTYSCVKCWLNLRLAHHIQQNFLESEKKLHEMTPEIILDKESDVVLNDGNETNEATEGTHAPIIQSIKSELEEDSAEFIIIESDNSQFNAFCNCLICGVSMEDDHEYYSHIKEHYNEEQTCEDCGATLGDITSYRDHILSKHTVLSSKTWKCSICQLSFQYKPLYNVHLRSAHGELLKTKQNQKATGAGIKDQLKCLECNKVFLKRSAYSAHVKGHTRVKCPICSAEITRYNISKHVMLHNSGPSVCHLCGVELKNIESLRGHLYYTHSKKRFSCEQCGRVFSKAYNYKIHIKKEHTGEKGFTCDTCGKGFFTQYTLNKHVKMTHLKLRPHICKYCKKGFSSRFALRTHERQHTNEAPYICDVCGEGFRQKVSMRAHRKSKHNIIELKKVKCPTCAKMFINDVALRSHVMKRH
ncbi:gastrula zinc finger protein XlCGF28.1-like [Cylas formicarius]|uniref:gastrula zinc finger protein XlCGF28.1-like n=1 Tax=Cylas formicarius TaxID=197179 RepID=UPI00295893D0|nr:gastrula zinc finger protein XlCGF28.1-like [Cylas formicarius]XP_060530373.1 gastrula zinc finger protein XlCGF28.1-like [Cylas formicarius]